jgi:hypothetical protein
MNRERPEDVVAAVRARAQAAAEQQAREEKATRVEPMTIPAPPPDSCGNCHTYRDGECRYRAPMLVFGLDGKVYSGFPQMPPDGWCGDYEPKRRG